MTGIKVALSAIGIIAGLSSSTTGVIIANVPAISAETPVNLTLALVGGGLFTTSIMAWKVSRAWTQMENRVISQDERIKTLERFLPPIQTPRQ